MEVIQLEKKRQQRSSQWRRQILTNMFCLACVKEQSSFILLKHVKNSFPTIPARQWGHCFGTVRPVGLAIWRDLSHLFGSSLRWSFKGCGNSSNRGRSGRTTCRALGSALVLSCWWVGVWHFFHSVTKDEDDTKVDWTWFQSSMDLWCGSVGSQQQMPVSIFQNWNETSTFFLNESNIWSMEAVIWKSKISHEANLWKRPIGGWKGAPGGQFYGCRSCSMPSFREAVCCLTSMHGQTRGRRFVASNW